MIILNKFKILLGFSVITLLMTFYITVMGYSSNRASAVAIHDFSQAAIDNWHYVSTSLNIPLDNTKPGMLAPVIPNRFSALDLVIYGHEIVSLEYRDDYQQLDMPRMISDLHISTDVKGDLNYNVGGIQLLNIQNSNTEQGAVFFIDVPGQLIDVTSKLYDGVSKQGDRDGTGIVRYDRLKDGRNVMGIYLPYSDSITS